MNALFPASVDLSLREFPYLRDIYVQNSHRQTQGNLEQTTTLTISKSEEEVNERSTDVNLPIPLNVDNDNNAVKAQDKITPEKVNFENIVTSDISKENEGKTITKINTYITSPNSSTETTNTDKF